MFPPSLSVLRSHRSQSGYRNVYRSRRGWRSLVRMGGHAIHVGNVPSPGTPEDAARLLIDWYAAMFGPTWPAIVQARTSRNPYSVRLIGGKGFALFVYVRGQSMPVRNGRRDFFPDAKQARTFAIQWLQKQFGNEWPRVAWWDG